jgi:hypothetical protein
MATAQRKTPGVYISEPDSFPPAVVGVDTAVPAFIGVTERASDKGKNLNLVPTRVTSLADYASKFGRYFAESYYLLPVGKTPAPDDTRIVEKFSLHPDSGSFQLIESGRITFAMYNSLELFFRNGGGDCYIVSCGTYDQGPVTEAKLLSGLDAIQDVVGPTMLVVPDKSSLERDPYNNVVVAMLQQCLKKQDRVALIDIRGAAEVNDDASMRRAVDAFRVGIAGAPPESLRYGIAYFPYLRTSMVTPDEVGIDAFAAKDTVDTLKGALRSAIEAGNPGPENAPRREKLGRYVDMIGSSLPDDPVIRATPHVDRTPPGMLTHAELGEVLRASIPGLGDMFHHAAISLSTLPPSGAMAGVFSMTDSTRGVWNAPANVGIAGLIEPTYNVNDDQQADLNVPTEGKAVNAIRTFPTRGSLVWGARTLDSNSNDWKYIQVRRTMIYVEQSVKLSLNSFVFEPNTAATWTTVVSMVESFLHGLWSSGGLMGATPGEAYSVRCGLGSTMTPDDILNGIMVVHVVLQMVRPAEFIELVFKQQMAGGA